MGSRQEGKARHGLPTHRLKRIEALDCIVSLCVYQHNALFILTDANKVAKFGAAVIADDQIKLVDKFGKIRVMLPDRVPVTARCGTTVAAP
jgi:hypothetical protein